MPPAIAARFTVAARAVPDTDWHVEKLYAFARAPEHARGRDAFALRRRPQPRPVRAARCIPARTTRSSARRGRSTTRRSTSTAAPDDDEVAARRAAYFEPYHAVLAAESRPRPRAARLGDPAGRTFDPRRGAAVLRGAAARPQPRQRRRRRAARRRCARPRWPCSPRPPASPTSSTADSRAGGSPATTAGPTKACTRCSSRSRRPATWTRRRRTVGAGARRRARLPCSSGWPQALVGWRPR